MPEQGFKYLKDNILHYKGGGLRINSRRVLRAFELIHYVCATLDYSFSTKEPCYAILASMLSPYGLGLSGTLCFAYNTEKKALKGHLGFIPPDRTSFCHLWRSLVKKQRETFSSFDSFENPGGNNAGMYNLVESFENQGTETFKFLQSTTRQIQDITIEFSKRSMKDKSNVLSTAGKEKRILIVRKENVRAYLPNALLTLLPELFVIVPICDKDKVNYVFFVDRRYQGLEFNPVDLLQLEWFRSHTSLMLSNARLISDYEHMYEEVKQIDDLKTNFLSIISHELRTPITSIYGFLELLAGGKAGELMPAQKELLDRVIENSRLLMTKVNDLIELAHIKIEGLEHPKLVSLDPLSVFMNVLPRLAQRSKAKGLDIEPLIEGEIPLVLADEKALEKIFFHLLDNAVKFSPRGGKVSVEFSQKDDKVHISFNDQGPGIPNEKFRQIFDAFYQVEEPMTRNYEGLGIGLTISGLLLHATGGSLEVESNSKEGSCFTVKYPIVTY